MSDSPLADHARYELERAGMFDKDADYGPGAIAQQVLDLVNVVAGQGHSGMSIEYTLALFDKVVRYQNLTPLTSDPDEWIDRSQESGYPFWQNRRRGTTFSTDGGKTWYDLNDPVEVVAG